MTLVGGVGDRAVPWPRLTTREDAGGAGWAGSTTRKQRSQCVNLPVSSLVSYLGLCQSPPGSKWKVP